MNGTSGDPSPGSFPSIAGHPVLSQERAGGLLNLRVALGGAPLVTLARALARLDGVRVTTGPEAEGRQRCYLVHCAGFKLVLSTPGADPADDALALVSRAPQAALALMSELDVLLDGLMKDPPPVEAPAPEPAARPRRSALRQGAPLARKTPLQRKTPLARGSFKRARLP
jgi:hypothetical protein